MEKIKNLWREAKDFWPWKAVLPSIIASLWREIVLFWRLPLGWLVIALTFTLLLVMFDADKGALAYLLGTKDEGKRETIKFIALGMGGVLAVMSVIMLNRRVDAMVQSAAAQAKSAAAMAENNILIEKGHIDERFKAAVQSLGHQEESVRIAAFYQFYLLAKNNPDKDFVKNIFDMMCVHLRQITSRADYRNGEGRENPTGECQSLLDVLFKNPQNIFVVADMRVDLQGVYLVGANFHKAHLQGVSFKSANLQHALFWSANVEKAFFTDSNLQNANFTVAHAHYAFFQGADVEGADFTNADLHIADMTYVKNLDKANFHRIKGKCIFPTGFENFTELRPGKKYPE